jgi:hypothetical protein
MASDYTSFYLKDLLPMIDKLALDSQRDPDMIMISKGDEQLYLLKNASVAAYNRGIMKMREQLVAALTREEADPDG